MADEEKEAIEAVNRLLTAGDPLGAAKRLKRLQKTVECLPIPQEVWFEVETALPLFLCVWGSYLFFTCKL